MTYNRAKNIYIGAIIVTFLSFLGAVFMHFSISASELAVLKVILLGIGCGLLPLIFNLTQAGLLTQIIFEFRHPIKSTSKTKLPTVKPQLKESPVLNRHSA